MSTTARPLLPGTAQLKKDLFEDSDERLFFISEFIAGDEPTHAMPWELEEQQPELGAVLVRTEDQLNWLDAPRITGEVIFLNETEVESKSDAAVAWAKATAARDICPLVVSYQLDADGSDFGSLQLLPLLDHTAAAERRARFRYDGIAYPLPFSRAITLQASGAYEVLDVLDGEEGELWFAVRNLDNGEELYVTGVLMLTARFG